MLPAGAVLGEYAYWSDAYLPANLTASIEAIERQIGETTNLLLPCFCDTIPHMYSQHVSDGREYAVDCYMYLLLLYRPIYYLLCMLQITKASP
mgnify:FL=1